MTNPAIKNPSNHWKKYKFYYLIGAAFLVLFVFILLVNSKNTQEIRKINQRFERKQKGSPWFNNPNWDFPEEEDKKKEYDSSNFIIPDPKMRNTKWVEETIPNPEIQQQVRNWINGFKYLPDYRAKYGPEINRHVLLSGPTGSGKSYLAGQFCQNESCAWKIVHFETVLYKGSSILAQKAALRAAQNHAEKELKLAQSENRKPRPVVMLIEEIDSVGIKDMTGLGSAAGRDEVDGLLKMFDHIQTNDLNITIIATTNYPDALDDALVRPGRLGRRIEVPYPTDDQIESLVWYVEKTMKDEHGYKTPDNQLKWNEKRKDSKKIVRWPANFWDQVVQETKAIKKKYSKVEITKQDGSREEVEAEIGFAFPDISQIIGECLSAKTSENQTEIVPDINDYKKHFGTLMKQKVNDWSEKVMRGKPFRQKKRLPVPPKEKDPE